ncbi:MAG: Xaa-Pro aminopeptidase [Candidatus Saccharibacteria bacterium]|nr:Xaa-Pro aminopeptidase [Candidatus Saccharibacteria bacterium]
MKSYFTSDFFIGNRKRLRQLFSGTAPIVMSAAGRLQRSRDSAFPFRQDSNFWYLTGIDEADVLLVLDKDKEYLILPELSEVQQIFDGVHDEAALREKSGISEILTAKEGWKRLGLRVKRVRHVATLSPPPSYQDQIGLYTNPARSQLVSRLKQQNQNLELLDLTKHLVKMRQIKQPPELESIRAAVDLTTRAFKESSKYRSSWKREYEAEAFFTGYFRSHGATHAYEPIVASGINACVLHYNINTANIGTESMLLMDIGAEVQGYAADITRTYTTSEPTKRQRAVLNAVVSVQEFAYSCLKPGVTMREYEQKIETYAGEKLRELGLIKTIKQSTVRQYFPHATSHFLGLDVHDVGDYSQPLEAGMVLTVEPGIYIPKENIGVRIEDDIVITKSGIDVLSSNLPRLPA